MLRILLVPYFMVFAALAQAAEPLRVVSSVRAVELLVTAIGGEDLQSEVLVPPGASPHSYALRFSDMARLQQADLVVWVGPALETYLVRPLVDVPATKALALLPDNHPGHGHEDHVEVHPWLSPPQALVLAARIRDRLSVLDPAHGLAYQRRYEGFVRDVNALDQRLQLALMPLRQRGFIVSHRAYDGLVDHYGLKQVGSISLTPEQKPGVRHLLALHDKVKNGEVACIFYEPGVEARFIAAVTGDVVVKTAELDPEAKTLPPGPDAYLRYLRGLGATLEGCLRPGD